MPRISEFNGIAIYMYYNDHMPPHFHALYGEYEVIILIGTRAKSPSVYAGDIPKAQLKLILQWANLYSKELRDDWELARRREPLKTIAPLKK